MRPLQPPRTRRRQNFEVYVHRFEPVGATENYFKWKLLTNNADNYAEGNEVENEGEDDQKYDTEPGDPWNLPVEYSANGSWTVFDSKVNHAPVVLKQDPLKWMQRSWMQLR